MATATTQKNDVEEIRRSMAQIRQRLHQDMQGMVAGAEAASEGKRLLAAALAWLPRRLAEVVVELAGMPADRRAAGLSRPERARLVAAMKRTRVRVNGTLGFGRAEVTAGGVALGEVDSRTMRSKLVEGLYFAGEVLDLDGPIGGYNFQSAWSTGWLAGRNL